jgi:cytosine deaminase
MGETYRIDGARGADGRPIRWAVRDGLVVEPGDLPTDAPALDLDGSLVLPGLVEGHVHLDKTLLGTPWRPHVAGDSVRSRVENEKAIRRELTLPVQARAELLLQRCLAAGTTRLRTHVDIDEVTRLDNLHALLRVRETWRGRIDIEIVAFPQSGIVSCPPARDLMDAALAEGADLVGGLDPVGYDGDLDAHLDVVFGLAERHGRAIDIHLHDRGESGLAQIAAIAARTGAAALGRRVTISHAFALADADERGLEAISASLHEAGVALLSSVPGGPHCPPIPALRERGVEVFLGTDNIRDAWSPMTVIGMIERMALCAWRFGLRRDEDLAGLLDLATAAPFRVMGGPPPLTLGAPADFIVLEAENVPHVIAARLSPRAVYKGGRKAWVAATGDQEERAGWS